MIVSFQTIEEPSEGFLKEKGSKFFAYAFPVRDENQINEQLIEVKKMHNKARHHCYAWRLGLDDNFYRANDDGEPSGTAGKPILGQIDKLKLTNVLVVVVRYFGGTLLGTGGLIQAYKTAAELALHEAKIITQLVQISFAIQYDYAHTSDIMSVIKQFDAQIDQQDFSLLPSIYISLPLEKGDDFLLHLKAQCLKVSLEEAAVSDFPENIEVKPC